MLLSSSGFGPAFDGLAVTAMACFGVVTALPKSIQLLGIPSLNDTICMPPWIARFNLVFAFCALVMAHLAAVFFPALVRWNGVFEAMAPVRCRATGVPHGEWAPLTIAPLLAGADELRTERSKTKDVLR